MGEFSASWSADDNGSPITRWVVDDGGLSGGPGSTARNYTWTNVSAGSYTIRVQACNAVDCGPVGSSRVTVTEAPRAPGQAVVTASGGVGEFSASWSADDNGSPITRWVVDDGGLSGGPGSTARNYTWTNVSAGSYTIRVQACNAVDCGPVGSSRVTVTEAPRAPGQAVVTASGGVGEFSASWSADDNGSPITRWVVDDGGLSGGPGSTARNYTWTNVSAGSYTIRVQACNAVDCGPVGSSRVTVTEAPRAPGQAVVTASGGVGEFSASWSADDNGSSITRWVVDDGGLSGGPGSTARNYTWTNVSAGSYTIRVQACNAVGCGDWGSSTPVTVTEEDEGPALPPLQAQVDASGGVNSVSASWSAEDNGSPITQWRVRSDWFTGRQDFAGSVTQTSWSSVPAGTHTIRIRACSSDRCGPWGEATVMVEPPEECLPGQARVTGSGGVNSVSASWSAVNDCSSLITRWVVDDGGLSGGPGSTATSFTWTNVSAGSYTIRVQACNAAGCGPEGSDTADVGPVCVVPERPTIAATGGVNQITASWSADDNDCSITRWVVGDGGLSGGPGSTATSFTWTNVSAGSYTIRVQACNAAGCGPEGSDTADVGPVCVVPERPTIAATGGVNQITASWSADDNDCSITRWVVGDGGLSGGPGSTATSFTWTNVSAGSYTIRVQACNAAGCGPEGSDTADVGPVCVVPERPTIAATGGVNQITASWSADDNDCSITRWVVGDGGLSGGPGSTATSFTWTNVSAGSHTIRVHACNAAGCGPDGLSRVTVTEAATVPGQAVVSASGGENQITASWLVADDGGSLITHWMLNGSRVSASVTSRTWTDLAAGNYTIRVQACNVAGCGSEGSARVTVTEAATVPGQAVVSASGGVNQITASWLVADDGGSLITHWMLNGSRVSASVTSWTWTDLAAGNYTIRVQACNVAGCGSEGSASARVVDPVPQRSVRLSKGSPQAVDGCTTAPPCRYLTVELVNFDSGTYNVYCYHRGWTPSKWEPGTWYNYQTSNNVSNYCVMGVPGITVYVVVDGVYSNDLVW